MPKRSSKQSLIESYRKKIRKLEQNENQRTRRRIILSSSDSEDNSDDEIQDQNGLENNAASSTADPLPEEAPSLDTVAPEIAESSNQEVPPELDPDILSALGEATEEAPKFGEKIHDKLAQLWLPILRKGLAKETKDKLLKQFLVPENCSLLQAPKLNPEISAAISEPTRLKDKRVESVQQQLGLGLTALNRGLSLLLDADTDKVLAIKHLSDSCRILCDLHFIETEARKKFSTPGLEKHFLSMIKDVDRDDTLFGNKLADKIKASKAIEKQGLQIKKAPPAQKVAATPATQANNSRFRPQGNWSGPPRYSSNRGGRGGLRKPAPATNRRSAQPPQSRTSTSSSKQHAPAQQQ